VSETLPQYAWHVHHDRLVEILTAPMQERIDFINESKAERERPLRLRLFKLVKNQSLIASIDEAYEKARATADEAYEKVMAPAYEAYEKAINDLHEKECRNCPWNGETIFSGKVRA